MALSDTAPPHVKQPIYKLLYFQVIVAIILGVTLGYVMPETGAAMKPLADGFIKLIKMLIAPIIFCTVVTGIAGMSDMKNAGRVGLKALIYFEVMTTLALVIGLFIVNVYQPGAGMNIDPSSLDGSVVAAYSGKASEELSFAQFVLNVIPHSLVGAFAEGDILQVLLVSLFVAAAIIALGEKGQGMYNFINQLSAVLFKIVGFVVKLAPLGAFGAMAFTIGKYGIESLGSLMSLMIGFYLTCVIFVAVALGAVMRMCGLRLWPLLKYIKEEFFIVLGTSSSETVLPRLIEKLTKMGCSRPVVGMVIPTGYSFNLDGTCIYLTMAAIFIAQALNIELTIWDELTLLSVLLLTSKGAAGVTGSGFIVLAGTLSAMGNIPVEGLALILGIDRFMSEARALTNMIGNSVATVVVARWEKALDMNTARAVLSQA